jgi:hypothetical protein
MDRLTARALMMNRKNRKVPVPFSLPDLQELDGQLSVMELPAEQIEEMAKMAETSTGVSNSLAAAASIVKALVLTATSERIFEDNDLGTVAGFGSTINKPLSDMVADVCGLSPDAMEAAKKNLVIIPASGSSTSSQENLVTPERN